jgi:hypothetical protein
MRALYYPEAEPSLAWLRTFALFYDSVGSIVPEDWHRQLSPDVSEFGARFPSVYQALPPLHEGRYLYNLPADLLASSLDVLGARPTKKFQVIIGPNGDTSIPGFVFMHRDKLPPDVTRLLHQRGLLLPEFDDRAMVVEGRASNLILAHIATDIAERTGWSTATDRDVEFYFTSLGRLRARRDDEVAQDRLASAIIQSEVPKDILGLSWSRYRVVREAYADLRRPFEELVSRLTRQSRISGITDPVLLKAALADVCKDFNNEVEKFTKTRFWRKVESTAPVALASLMAVTGTVLGVAAPQKTFWRLALPLGSVAIHVYRAAVGSADGPAVDRRVYQLMADIKRDIVKPERLRSLF